MHFARSLSKKVVKLDILAEIGSRILELKTETELELGLKWNQNGPKIEI